MIQTSFPSLPIISGETREGKLYLKYADGTEIEAGILPDKTSLGLDLVNNTPDAEKHVAQAERVANALSFTGGQTYDGSEAVEIGKEAVGLGKVENKTGAEILSGIKSDNIFAAFDGIPQMHRNLYRGKNLGESTQMSEAHKQAIKDGTFHDLWVGDCWTHDEINYRIADIDYFYNCGDTSNFTQHHLVIVPDTALVSGADAKMNDANDTTGGYVLSRMYKTTIPNQVKPKITAAFGELVLTHRDILVNAVADGHASDAPWFDSTVELMNEIMVYGCFIFAPMNDGKVTPANYTTANSQLAMFRLNPGMIKTRYNYWLRDVVSATVFAFVGEYGDANCTNASNTYLGVRPYFCIG